MWERWCGKAGEGLGGLFWRLGGCDGRGRVWVKNRGKRGRGVGGVKGGKLYGITIARCQGREVWKIDMIWTIDPSTISIPLCLPPHILASPTV